ncbi:MAG: HD domain-containing protein, partial [Sediminibacterium sp.]
IIRLLALLHDIGHMPFGHTIEDEFNIFQSHDKHESRWEYFLGANSEIGKKIILHAGTDEDGLFDERKGNEFHKRFFNLIKCEKDFTGMEEDAYMYDIVSNTVCADLLDYLQRDCEYTNLKLDYHPRFLDYLVIKRIDGAEEHNPPQRRIVIRLCKISNEPRKDIYSELVQLLRNRYYLGERVYYHHTKIKTGTLIAGAVLRAKQANFFKFLDGHSDVRTYQNQDGPLYDLHTWNDMNLITRLSDIKAKDSTQSGRYLIAARNLANAYLNREVYTQLDFYTQRTLGLNPTTMQEVIDKKIDLNAERILEVKLINEFGNPITRLSWEDYLVDLLPDLRSGDFLIYFPSYKMQMKLADVKIEEDDGVVRRLRKSKEGIIESECDEIIEKHKSLWMMRVFVHPKFTKESHPEYKKDIYPMYARIMKKYCKWIFARNEAEAKDAGEDFWKELISFKIDNELDGKSEETMRIYNPIPNAQTGKKHKQALIGIITETCQNTTSKRRTNDEVIDMIKSSFLENDKL